MSGTSKNNSLSIDTIKEIIGDLFCFDFILEIKRRMNDEEAKAYIANFLRILAPIYIHEISNALDKFGLIAKDKLLSPEYQKRIDDERQLSAHKVINSSSDAQKAINEMGISFNSNTYDINIVVRDNLLFDLNFESYIAPLCDFDFWNFLFLIPHAMLKAAFSAISPDFDLDSVYTNNSKQLDSIARQLDDVLSLTRYSYSSHKLFQNSHMLEQSDKLLILYRYRMITSIKVTSENLPSLYATTGDTQIIDIECFFKKYRALLIVILGDELLSMNTAFTDEIKAELAAKITDPSFYQKNRKLRNNLHYERTDKITEAEMDIITRNQPIYLSIIEKHFKSVINVNIDKQCKIMTGFSTAYQASGIPRSELEKYYYFYYLKYRIMGRL